MVRRPPPIPSSFRAFLRTLPPEDSPAGDFIATTKADRAFPDVKTWRELRKYLNQVGTINTMAVGARMVWRRYRNAVREASTQP